DVVDRADVRMVQRRGDSRFAPEAFERLGVRGQLGRQELERDLTAEPDVFGAVDDAHAAAADAFENPIMTDSGADHCNCAAMLPRLIQLSRRTAIGSMRAARRAGSQAATAAMRHGTSAAPTSVAGSCGGTP